MPIWLKACSSRTVLLLDITTELGQIMTTECHDNDPPVEGRAQQSPSLLSSCVPGVEDLRTLNSAHRLAAKATRKCD